MNDYVKSLIMATVISEPVTVDELVSIISKRLSDVQIHDIDSIIDEMMQQSIIWEDCTGIILISPGLSPIVTDA